MSAASPDPVLASLERLHQRLDTLEARLAPLESLVTQAPGLIAMATDSADGLARRLGEGALDARLSALARVVEGLTRPEALALLEGLVAREAQLHEALRLLDAAPGAAAMLGDTLDSLAARIDQTGVPLHERIQVLLGAMERLSSPAALDVLSVVTHHLPEVKALLTSGVLDPEAVRVVSLAGAALAQSRAAQALPLSPWGALMASRDPAVQRALGFAVAFARQIGAALADPTLPATR